MEIGLNLDNQFDNHPMDNFEVRPLEFDIENLESDKIVWSKSSPEFAIFINALGLHVPYFERYLINTMNSVRNDIKDENLRRDVAALIGQEAYHAKNFLTFNRKLSNRYPTLNKIESHCKHFFRDAAKHDSRKRKVGFTAGYETFTFIAGLIILNNYDKWMADSNPVMKALWIWHQVEEVEHGAVAFDVYRELYGDYEWYRKYMVLLAGLHILSETFKAYINMIRQEGWLKNPIRAFKSLSFLFSTLCKMAFQTLPVLKKNYDPRKHPMATSKQSPIAVAWRRFEKKGGNVLDIDREAMRSILKL